MYIHENPLKKSVGYHKNNKYCIGHKSVVYMYVVQYITCTWCKQIRWMECCLYKHLWSSSTSTYMVFFLGHKRNSLEPLWVQTVNSATEHPSNFRILSWVSCKSNYVTCWNIAIQHYCAFSQITWLCQYRWSTQWLLFTQLLLDFSYTCRTCSNSCFHH